MITLSIYLLTNQYGLPCYVGQTKHIRSRWRRHRRRKDLAVSGMAILEQCASFAEANAAEMKWIAQFTTATHDSLWNLNAGGHGQWPPELTLMIRKKIGDKLRGRPLTDEQKTQRRFVMQSEQYRTLHRDNTLKLWADGAWRAIATAW